MAVIIAIIGFALYAGMRLMPLYLEYTAIVRAMEQTAKESTGATGPQELMAALDRRWTVEDIHTIGTKDIEIKKVGSGYSLRAWYRAEAPFVGNVFLVAEFDKTVRIGAGGTGD
jgi:hypothetical protein